MRKTKSRTSGYIVTGLIFYGVTLIFSLLSLVFIADAIPKAVKIIFGFVFAAPVFIMIYNLGAARAAADFTAKASALSGRDKTMAAVGVNLFLSPLYTLSFGVPMLVLTLVGAAAPHVPVMGAVYVIYMPASLIFGTLGAVSLDPVTWAAFAVYGVYTLITCGTFVAAYCLRVKKLQDRRRKIAGEIRMFNS
ncbi:MAG: hypothetical protein LBP26_03610 [Clostridiales bacterium]|jgi:hypothetical protein|nr:hypothetical protein [Clostridiales bacterium]